MFIFLHLRIYTCRERERVKKIMPLIFQVSILIKNEQLNI